MDSQEREIKYRLMIQAADMKLAGRSFRDIAKTMDRNHQTIKVWLDKPEIQRYINERTRGGTIAPPPKFDMHSKEGRLAFLQYLADEFLIVKSERAAHAAYQDVPGGSTGLVTKTGAWDDKLLQTLLRAIDNAAKETGSYKETAAVEINQSFIGIDLDKL